MHGVVMDFLSSRGFSAATVETYKSILVKLVTDCHNLKHLSAGELINWINRHETWGSSQRYVASCACRSFLVWFYGEKHPAAQAKIKRIKSKRQRVLDCDHALDLLACFDTSFPKGKRDLAIAAVGLDTGLRSSELCRLKIKDIDLGNRTLQVVIKGGQWGIGVFSANTAQYINDWLTVRKALPGIDNLFVAIFHGTPLTRAGLGCIVKGWGRRIGIKLSPHDLRRSFATLSTIFGAPSRLVQIAGRWQSIEMVELYTRGIDPDAINPYLPVAKLKKT